MNTTADRYAHARERLDEARAALAKVAPPSSPEQDRDGLYYPLLFLCETVAPLLDSLGNDEPSPWVCRHCRANNGPDRLRCHDCQNVKPSDE